MAKRIQLSRRKGYRMPRNAVKVDRTSRWGNPWKVGDKPPYGSTPMTAEQAVAEYRRLLDMKPEMKARVKAELRGRDLACWCKPDAPCHADVLLEVANA